jgi:hypothetical protein
VDADLSSNSTDTSSCEDSDEKSTVSDTSSNAGTDGKANTDNKNSATGVTAIIAKLVNKKANSQSSSGLKHQSKSLKSNLIRVL